MGRDGSSLELIEYVDTVSVSAQRTGLVCVVQMINKNNCAVIP